MDTINKNLDTSFDSNQDSIAFIYNGESVKISGNEILYIEQCGPKLRICKAEKEIEVPGRISAIVNVLDEPFFLCHTYLIVNFSKIESMSKKRIIFNDQQYMDLGRDSYYKTRKLFNQYIAKTSKII